MCPKQGSVCMVYIFAYDFLKKFFLQMLMVALIVWKILSRKNQTKRGGVLLKVNTYISEGFYQFYVILSKLLIS